MRGRRRGGRDPVRRSYDAVAADYLDRLGDELSYKPLDRALLSTLVEQAAGRGVVADIGCGPGHVSGWLAGQGARVVGIDLSEAMIDVARSAHPGAEFRAGDMLSLPAADGEFTAAVALYSIIHLEPEEVFDALAEMRRVLVADGLLMLAFHIGTDVIRREEWWGHPVELDFRMLDPDQVSLDLQRAGFFIHARMERVPYPGEADTRRCYLMARRVG